MSEFTAEVSHKSDHAEIRINGYLSADSAEKMDEAIKQIGEAKKMLLIFDRESFINSAGLAALFDHHPTRYRAGEGLPYGASRPALQEGVRYRGAESGSGGV